MILPLGLDHDERYVLGFPLHVAILVCASTAEMSLKRLPQPSWAGNAGAIGVRLRRVDTGVEVLRVEPWPIVNPEFGTPIFSLGPGECRRMLVDVSSFLPADLDRGVYALTVIYVAPPFRAESRATPIELAAPSPDEHAELERLGPELAHERSWGRWASMPPEPTELLTKPTDASDPLRFNKVLKWLMYGPEELSDVDPALLDVLHGVYEPESHALRAELSFARGDLEGFAKQAGIVEERYPGLAWWIRRIERGQSDLAYARSCRGRYCAPRP
jgi:hypothetical protein